MIHIPIYSTDLCCGGWQGLVIADGEGNTIFSRELDRQVGVEGLQIARQHGALQLFLAPASTM